ncbi:hypothetical protein MRX96_029774 [Rhipicephalus microplus]
MCGPLNKEESENFMKFLHSECPIEPGSYTLTITATIPIVSHFRRRFKTCRCDEKGDEPACSTETAEHNAATLRTREQLRASIRGTKQSFFVVTSQLPARHIKAAKVALIDARLESPQLFQNQEHVCTRTEMSSKNKTLPVLITMQNNGEPVGCNTFYITVSE